MYNPQLDTFYVAATAGSFTKAAKELFITPSAVLQQINSLEKDLGVTLFIRGSQGLKLTEAGSYLMKQVKRVIDWNGSVRSTLKQLDKHTSDSLRVGVPKMHKSRCFFELWTQYSALHHDAKIDFIEAASSSEPDIGATYASLDLIEFVQLPYTWQDELRFLSFGDMPVLFAVPQKHKYYGNDILTVSQLKGEKIIVCDGPFYDTLRDYVTYLGSCGAEISIVPTYTHSTLDRAVFDNSIILLPECSNNVHPHLRLIHCEKEFTLPYGFYYSRNAESFIEFVKAQINSGDFVWQM